MNRHISIPERELDFSAVRSRGPGGQHVNKVSSAIQLRFDIRASSLPKYLKQRLLNCADRRVNKEGVIVIKAQEFRNREKNKQAARARLESLIRSLSIMRKKRIATKPTHASQIKRIDQKVRRGKLKKLRDKSGLYE